MKADFSGILKVRENYFNGLINDYVSYGPDNIKMTRGYLPKFKILDPRLNEIVALAYDEMTISSRNDEPDSDQKCANFENIRDRVIEHVKYKKENSNQEKLVQFDIWSRLFSTAKTKEEAQNYLNMSDHWEDLICLANLVLEFPNEDRGKHLIIRIEQLIYKLPVYTKTFKNRLELREKMRNLLIQVKEFFSENNYTEAQKKVVELHTLIQNNEIKG